MNLPAPFGRYELLEPIGSGGMAEVFLARSFGAAGFERKLVIKRIRPEHAKDPRFVSLLVKEAKVGVHLNHPNLVAIYELGKVGDSWYIAMEYVQGRDLTAILRQARHKHLAIPTQISVRIVADVLCGLGHAHNLRDTGEGRVGLIHRDISPHNVVVTFTGEIKVVDFGIAHLLDPEAPARAKPVSHGGGKFAYMSPEQLRGEAIDARSDLYSVGAVLWELLTGQRRPHPTKASPSPSPDPELDPALHAILTRALAQAPTDRYPHAAAFEEDLRAWLRANEPIIHRTELATLMSELFPEDSSRARTALDLQRLADDLKRLDSLTDPSDPNLDPSSPLPSAATSPPPDEYKRVAVLIVDIDGFDALSEQQEPQAVFGKRLYVLRWLRSVVDAWGGMLQRVQDDLATILFGVPRTRRDDLERALDCAAELQRRADELHREHLPVHFAIGVHTGELTVSRISERIRYTARGDTIQTARRLSAFADHGVILASEAVFHASERWFSYRRGVMLPGRGAEPATQTWRLHTRRSFPQITSEGPWLRRGTELDLLRHALKSLDRGRGSVVCIEGATGHGKSRLVREFATLARHHGLSVWFGRATSFGTPLAAVRELLLSACGLRPDADEQALAQSLTHENFAELPSTERAILEALWSTHAHKPAPSEAWSVLWSVLERQATRHPTVVVLEDIHLLPHENLVELTLLAQRLQHSPILLLVSSAEATPSLSASAYTITLPPFSPDMAVRLACARLGVSTLDSPLTHLIMSKGEGNPLYIDELVKYLLESGFVDVSGGKTARLLADADLELPDNLAGLLAARIDALGPASKGALQLAALIGVSFHTWLLADAIGIDDPTALLDDLKEHGLIRPTETDGVWAFASDFVQEAALRATLGTQRRDMHRLIAGAIERRHASQLDETCLTRLIAHCGEGGRLIDAARYAHTAGQRATAQGQLEHARAFYETGLRWIVQEKESPETWDLKNHGEALLRLCIGTTLIALGRESEAKRMLRIVLDIAEDSGLTTLAAQAHLSLGRIAAGASSFDLAQAHFEQAASRAHFSRDEELAVEITQALTDLTKARAQPLDPPSTPPAQT